MIQEILTYTTVVAAFGYTFYSAWKSFFTDNGKACGGGCPSCEAKDLLINDIKNNRSIKTNYKKFRPVR